MDLVINIPNHSIFQTISKQCGVFSDISQPELFSVISSSPNKVWAFLSCFDQDHHLTTAKSILMLVLDFNSLGTRVFISQLHYFHFHSDFFMCGPTRVSSLVCEYFAEDSLVFLQNVPWSAISPFFHRSVNNALQLVSLFKPKPATADLLSKVSSSVFVLKLHTLITQDFLQRNMILS